MFAAAIAAYGIAQLRCRVAEAPISASQFWSEPRRQFERGPIAGERPCRRARPGKKESDARRANQRATPNSIKVAGTIRGTKAKDSRNESRKTTGPTQILWSRTHCKIAPLAAGVSTFVSWSRAVGKPERDHSFGPSTLDRAAYSSSRRAKYLSPAPAP